jgi:hypothetical protein
MNDPNYPNVTSSYGFGRPRLQPPDLIIDGFLFLGTFEHARSSEILAYHDITFVLDVEEGGSKPQHLDERFYLARPMCDRGSTALPLIVDELIAFLDRVRAANARVLVHCEWGINRSATATLAYLVRRCDMTLRDALKHCRARRRVTQPLNAYIEQLATLERQWFPDRDPSTFLDMSEVPAIFESNTQS